MFFSVKSFRRKTMKISKKDFIEIMEELKISNDYQDGLNKYFRAHRAEGFLHQPDCMCAAIKLLHIILGELDKDEWIDYFCFELDFGRKWKKGAVVIDNKSDICLKTAEDLYNYLITIEQGGALQ